MFWLFGPKSCGILSPWPGMEPTPHTLEGGVLTAVLPENSPIYLIFLKFFSWYLVLSFKKYYLLKWWYLVPLLSRFHYWPKSEDTAYDDSTLLKQFSLYSTLISMILNTMDMFHSSPYLYLYQNLTLIIKLTLLRHHLLSVSVRFLSSSYLPVPSMSALWLILYSLVTCHTSVLCLLIPSPYFRAF